MHKFLRAVGFADLDEVRAHRLIRDEVIRPENIADRLELSDGVELIEYRLPVNEYIGVLAAVLYAEDIKELKYSYPYFVAREITDNEPCGVEKHTMTETYSGVVDNYDTGVSLIFFVSNPISLRREIALDAEAEFHGTALAAFANEGMVILPVEKHEPRELPARQPDPGELFMKAVLGGASEMSMNIDTMTIEDFTRMREISERIENEDLYSVVEQSFMPNGIECDLYSVVGEILEVEETGNRLSGARLYLMKLSCNDVVFWLCMRKEDLIGEPEPGRRLKCRLWMQGSIMANSGGYML